MSALTAFLHFIPLSMVISLVYNCSRFEMPQVILTNSARMFAYITLFMSLMFGILWGCSYSL